MLEGNLKKEHQNGLNALAFATAASRLLLLALLILPVTLVEVVAQENRAPFLEPASRHELAEGQILDLVITPFDPDGVPPSLSLLNAPSGARLETVGGGSHRLIWAPTADQTGVSTIILVARDAVNPDLQASRRLEITVNGAGSQQGLATAAANSSTERIGFANSQALTNQQVVAGSTFSVSVQGISDNGVPALILREAPAGARFTDNRDGTRTFSWTPSSDRIGNHTVVIVARHPNDASLESEQRFQLEVLDSSAATPSATAVANEPRQSVIFNDHRPIIQPLADIVTRPGSAVILRVTPVDPDGTFATLLVDPLPAGASFNDNGDGTRTFFWQTTESDRGEHRFTFTALDGLDSSLSHSESLLVTVGAGPISRYRLVRQLRNVLWPGPQRGVLYLA